MGAGVEGAAHALFFTPRTRICPWGPRFSASQAALAVHVEAGGLPPQPQRSVVGGPVGLRVSGGIAVKRSRSRCTAKLKPCSTTPPAVLARMGAHFQHHRRAGLGVSGFAQHYQAAPRMVRRLPKAKPCGGWNPAAVLRRNAAKVQNNCGKSARLEQQVRRLQCLVESRPGFRPGPGCFAAEGLPTAAQSAAEPSPQRTQSSCRRDRPLAAADSGSKASFASTHAQNRSNPVRCARNLSARLVRPDDSGPVSSVMAPMGRPPSSSSSTGAIPVAATSRMVRWTGVSAAGKRCCEVAFDLEAKGSGGVHRRSNIRFLFAYRLTPIASLVKYPSGTGRNLGYSVRAMCGRFARKSTQEVLAEWFDLELEEMPWFAPSYNIAPQSTQPVVRLGRDSGRRETALLRWGLVPFWAKDAKDRPTRPSTPARRKWHRSRPTARRSRSAAAWFPPMRSTSGSGSTPKTKRPLCLCAQER